jgi:hypothetical protein
MNSLKPCRMLFKTPAHEAEYLKLYDEVLSLWPVQHEPLNVGTTFGTTHINAAGPQDGPPLVLIPGFGANSTMWFANVGPLSRNHRIYALDTNGQPGRSTLREPLSPATVCLWLHEVLDGIGVQRAVLAGAGGPPRWRSWGSPWSLRWRCLWCFSAVMCCSRAAPCG